MGDPLWQTRVGEDADAHSPGMDVAGKRDNGYAHDQGVAGCCGAVVREGVQRDVNVGVGGEMVAMRIRSPADFEAVFGNALGDEPVADMSARRGVAEGLGFDEKAR